MEKSLSIDVYKEDVERLPKSYIPDTIAGVCDKTRGKEEEETV